MLDDEENIYVRALSKGDQRAFEILFLKYQPKLVNFLNGFLKDMELSRDMSQDIFLKVWQHKEIFEQISSFKAYLFRMAHNVINNYYDHSLVDVKFRSEQLFAPVITDNVETSLFAKQLQELIDLTVSMMPRQRRLIYNMSRVDGLSNSEIAEKLKLNKRTIENYLTAALAEIRKVIKASFFLF